MSNLSIEPTTKPDVPQRLFAAVDTLIERLGYRKMSVENVVREAGVSRATAYLYFANKEALVVAWVAERARRRLRLLDEMANGSGSFEERMRAVLVGRVMLRYDSAYRWFQSWDDLIADLRTAGRAQRDEDLEAETRMIQSLLQNGVESGELRRSDTMGVARTLVMATNGILSSTFAFHLGCNQDQEPIAREVLEQRCLDMFELLYNGLRA